MPKPKGSKDKSLSDEAKGKLTAMGLQELKETARHVVDDLLFLIQSSGEKLDRLELDCESLNKVEAFYRKAAHQQPTLVDIEQFEQLMATMLGETLMATHGGQWIAYDGKYYVLTPFVIALPSGKFVDVFLFCKLLWKKPSVAGASSARSLATYVNNVEKFAFL